MKSINKYIEKLEHQAKTNPGHKSKYVQPLRPRSARFDLKTAYKRSNNKKAIREAIHEY